MGDLKLGDDLMEAEVKPPNFCKCGLETGPVAGLDATDSRRQMSAY
jgi:hypothetical protein